MFTHPRAFEQEREQLHSTAAMVILRSFAWSAAAMCIHTYGLAFSINSPKQCESVSVRTVTGTHNHAYMHACMHMYMCPKGLCDTRWYGVEGCIHQIQRSSNKVFQNKGPTRRQVERSGRTKESETGCTASIPVCFHHTAAVPGDHMLHPVVALGVSGADEYNRWLLTSSEDRAGGKGKVMICISHISLHEDHAAMHTSAFVRPRAARPRHAPEQTDVPLRRP